jgi:hypothetical protein
MRIIGKAIEEHKTCEGIAFEEWRNNLRKVRGEIQAEIAKSCCNYYTISALPSAIIACDRFAFTLATKLLHQDSSLRTK